MRSIALILGVAAAALLGAQPVWTWEALPTMPIPTANNAVCSAQVDGVDRIYSFGGITTGLDRSDIHREAFCYDTGTGMWTTLPTVPDTLGKIASAAHVVNGVAYVIGGYHVLAASPFEVSSNKVHRFDLATSTWLIDGSPIPIPIDDHVQAVWRDSLIYVITGWSNNTNVAAVQIYDPGLNAWSVGTAVPNNNLYKVFGGSGTIIGDTIYYYGGASLGSNFPAQDELRIGVIDPLQPMQITWQPALATGRSGYRSACGTWAGRPFWLGGSSTSYNYDAVAYNGSGIVQPVTTIAWSVSDTPVLELSAAQEPIMDLRGIGEAVDGTFHVCGGIGNGSEVLDTHWRLSVAVGMSEAVAGAVRIYPVPSSGTVTVVPPYGIGSYDYAVFDGVGRLVLQGRSAGGALQVDLTGRLSGTYTVKLISGPAVTTGRFWYYE
ncbi:MAG: T9SS type A sorting domain-containing protein [Flavobacteriales bacterium]|nr:T9SS type A sorting domain-containing protein [Flavobacteriales bacterium]